MSVPKASSPPNISDAIDSDAQIEVYRLHEQVQVVDKTHGLAKVIFLEQESNGSERAYKLQINEKYVVLPSLSRIEERPHLVSFNPLKLTLENVGRNFLHLTEGSEKSKKEYFIDLKSENACAYCAFTYLPRDMTEKKITELLLTLSNPHDPKYVFFAFNRHGLSLFKGNKKKQWSFYWASPQENHLAKVSATIRTYAGNFTAIAHDNTVNYVKTLFGEPHLNGEKAEVVVIKA